MQFLSKILIFISCLSLSFVAYSSDKKVKCSLTEWITNPPQDRNEKFEVEIKFVEETHAQGLFDSKLFSDSKYRVTANLKLGILSSVIIVKNSDSTDEHTSFADFRAAEKMSKVIFQRDLAKSGQELHLRYQSIGCYLE